MQRCFFSCISLLFAGVLSLYLSGCTSFQAKEGRVSKHSPTSPPALKPGKKPSVPLKVGLLLPLSGPHQQLGKAFQRAAELSLFDGDGATNIVLVARDTQGTQQGAQQAFSSCLQEGVQGFLGPLFAFEVKSIQPLLKQAQKPLLTFSTDTTLLGDGIFTLGFLPIPQIRCILEDASQEGLKKIAAILPKGSYGKLMTEEIQKFAFQYQLSVDVVGYYDPKRMGNDQQAKEELQGIMNALERDAFQAILIPEGGKSLEKILATFSQANLSMPSPLFLGTGQWQQSQTASFPYLEQAKIAAPSLEGYNLFQKRFSKVYGAPCPRIATLAYDAITLMKALEQLPGHFSKENLLDASGFQGIDGAFRFLPNGQIERGLSILIFSKGKWEVFK
ncbi:MAG: penicillin-binding protein activator [Alphaproteobacteria bacterium]